MLNGKMSKAHGSLELEIRRLDLLYRQSIAGIIAIFVNTTAFLIVTWDSLPKVFLISWFLILNASVLIRYFAYYAWQRASIKRIEHTHFWFYFMYSSLALSGLGWGIIGWIAPHGSAVQQILTAMIISCMTVGAMITYISSRISMASVTIPAMLLWSLGYLFSDNSHHLVLAFLICFYGFLMTFIGKNLNVAIMNSLRIGTELKKSEERLRLSMEASDALIWDWDLLEDQLYWEGNTNLISRDQSEFWNLLKTSLKSGIDLDSEHIFKDEAGFSRHIAIRGKLYRAQDGRLFRFAGICWDVTVKKNEEILRRERDMHEAANRAKSIFIANASHEIRTPLAAILGFSEALLRSASLTDQNRKDVLAIYRQSNYMGALVNDLLDLSKVETNRLYIQKAPMDPLQEIEDSISVIRSALDEKKLALNVVYGSLLPESIEADSVRFRQVLINLLSNAVKFTHQGTITVKVSFASNTLNEGLLSILVSDTGLGMDTPTQENLFQPFIRGEDPEVQRVQGSGLGLALSLRLMKGMGGSLHLVSSSVGEGSTFEMRLNLGSVENLKLIPSESTGGPLKPKAVKEESLLKGRRVLVVDDSVDLRVLMQRYLAREGAQVEMSENGAEAIAIAMNNPFDIILMDIKMPVMDGYVATRILRQKGYTNPIVALTAQASVDGQNKSYEMGFDGYLSKPVDMALLKKILLKRSVVLA